MSEDESGPNRENNLEADPIKVPKIPAGEQENKVPLLVVSSPSQAQQQPSTSRPEEAASKKSPSKKRKKSKRNGPEQLQKADGDVGDKKLSRAATAPPPASGVRSVDSDTVAISMTSSSTNKKSRVMDRYLDEQYDRWNSRNLKQIPSTFNAQPDFVRRLSYSLSVPSRLRQARKHNDMMLRKNADSDNLSSEDTNTGRWDFGGRKKSEGKSSSRRRSKRRVCEKDGTANVKYKNVSEKRRRYFSDIYTTLVDSSWSTSLFLFALSFYITWLIYAVLYYIICYFHGDLEEEHLPDNQEKSGWVPCIWEIDGFAASFLFSLETQHTIGYGSRQTTTECVDAMIVQSTQSVIGCLIQAFMVGLVFAKLSVPNKRTKTVVFSKNAVICERDCKLAILFRVGDMRHDSYIVGAQLSAKLVKRRVTTEGEMFHDVSPLAVLPDSANEPCTFLIWPLTVVHVIDKESPFYRYSAPELAADKFEIHVVLEGTIESTSMTFQARTSYLPGELLWGHRFEQMMIYRKDHNKYQVNFSAFNSTYEVDTPLCSAKELEAHYKRVGKPQRPKPIPSPQVMMRTSSTLNPAMIASPIADGESDLSGGSSERSSEENSSSSSEGDQDEGPLPRERFGTR